MLQFASRSDRADLTGQQFGKLTVLRSGPKLDTKRKDGGSTSWVCKCECEREITVRTWQLRSANIEGRHKRVESCGCSRRKAKLQGDEASFRNLFGEYKQGAKNRGLVFDITPDQFRTLTSSDCRYCGARPNKLARANKGTKIHYVYNGVDRLDNEQGYIEMNCVPCCAVCNRMKFQMTETTFLDHIKRVTDYAVIG